MHIWCNGLSAQHEPRHVRLLNPKQQQAATAQHEAATATAAKAAADQEIASLKAQLAASASAASSTQDLTAQVNSLLLEVASTETARQQAEAQAEKLKKDLAAAEARVAAAEARVAEQLAAAEARAAEQAAAATTLRGQVAELQASLKSVSEERDALRAELKQLAEEVATGKVRLLLVLQRAVLCCLVRPYLLPLLHSPQHYPNCKASCHLALKLLLFILIPRRRPTDETMCAALPLPAQPKDLAAHAAAIRDILATEAAKHRDVALAYANEKLPGLKV